MVILSNKNGRDAMMFQFLGTIMMLKIQSNQIAQSPLTIIYPTLALNCQTQLTDGPWKQPLVL